MSECYPVLKIPKKILDIDVQIPEIKIPEPTVPLRTKKPVKPVKSKLIKPKKLRFILISLGVFFLSIFIPIPMPHRAIVLLLGFTVGTLIYFNNNLQYATKKTEYDSALRQYEHALKQWQDQELSITNSHSQILTNQIDFIQRNKVIEHYKHRFNQLEVLSPTPGSSAPKGRTEFSFYDKLNRYFPGQILIDYKMVKYVEYPYTPDFILHLPAWNLYVDIEIDEPYDAKKKKPTHCIDVPKDTNRDDFFLEKNWVVIRFAEEQIIISPKSCCKFIASVVSALTGQLIPEELQNTPRLRDVPRWNTKKAKRMARKKYRNYY